jgi:glycyl-tRNA synthetase alpha subunit
MSNALVPYKKNEITEYVYEFKLVDEDINLDTREAVKDQLPEILGRALARSWIDSAYNQRLQTDVRATLLDGQRAKIVVYERTGKLRLRVCGLHLTMMATR